MLTVCAVGSVVAQNKEIFSTNFSDTKWNEYSTSKSIASGTEINGMYFKCASSVSNGQLVIEGGNMKTSNYWICVPVKGINKKINITFTVPKETTNLRISVVEGNSYTSNYTNHTDINAQNNKITYEYTMTGTGNEAVIYFGRTGSKKNKIENILITTNNDKELKSETLTDVTINNVSVNEADLATLSSNHNLTLEDTKYQTAPSVVFTTNKTYSDNTTEAGTYEATVVAVGNYFTATATINDITYTINLGRDVVASKDATLKSISVNGTPITLVEGTTSYTVELPFGTTDVPTVTAEANDLNATVEITQAATLADAATIKVTAEDGTTTATYTVNFTVSKGSSENAVTKAIFSNGFDGFIKENTIEAYYMEGKEIPTLNATVSKDATYNVVDNILTVTAQDGTAAEYTIKLEPVSPYTGLGRVFDGTEDTWIKSGYGYDAAGKGWKFSKNVEEEANKRITEGKTRLYFFVDACNSVTLNVASGISSDRKIKYAVNDGGYTNATVNKASSNGSVTIACDKNSTNMIEIVSNQTGGDGGFGEITVDKDAPANITLNTFGYNTYSNANTVTATGAVAYTCTIDNVNNKVVLKELGSVIPAGQGVLLKGEANAEVSFAFGGVEPAIVQNDFKPVSKATPTPTDKAIYVLNGNVFKKYVGENLVANKAYIELGSTAGAKALSMDFGGGTTAIDGISADNTGNNAPVYNLNGQRVSKETKGILIQNGKKIINK